MVKERDYEKKQNRSPSGCNAPHLWGGASSIFAYNGGDYNDKTFGPNDELIADNGATLNLTDCVVNVEQDSFTTEGGTINAHDTTIYSGIWANENKEKQEAKVTVDQDSVVDGGTISAKGNSIITFDDATVQNVDRVELGKTVTITNEDESGNWVTDQYDGTSGGKVNFENGTTANVGSISVKDEGSTLTITGEETSVTAGSLSANQNAAVAVTGGTLKVTGDAALTNSTLEAAGGNTQLAGVTASGSTINVSGGTVNAGGTVNMTNNSSMNITSGSVTFNNWTATGGSTTVGETEGETNVSMLADDDAMTVTGTATLNGHQLVIESGKSAEYNAIDANEETAITVNGSMHVVGDVDLDNSKLTSETNGQADTGGNVEIDGNLVAANGSTVSVNNKASMTVENNVTLTGSELFSNGTTKIGGNLNSSEAGSNVTVTGGEFTVNGQTNTSQFYVEGGEVTLNAAGLADGGTMSGTIGTPAEDYKDGHSALYVKNEGTVVTANNVTFEDGEVSVDNGAKLVLNGGAVNAPKDWFTTEGGTIETHNTAIDSGVWANKGTVSVTGGSISGNVSAAGEGSSVTIKDVENATLDHVFAQQNLMDDNGEWTENGGASGGTVTFTNSTITANSIEAAGNSHVIINGGAQVTAKSLTVAGDGTVSVTGESVDTASHLLIDGNATFSDTSKLSVDSAANANVTGTLTFDDNAKMELTGENTAMTFASTSHLYATTSAPAITVSGGAALTFAKNASIHTLASETVGDDGKYAVNTVAKVEDGGTIDNKGASLFIENLNEEYKYSFNNVIDDGGKTTTWNGNAYGSSKLQKVDVATGVVSNQSVSEAYKGMGIAAAAAYDAVLLNADENSPAYQFIEAVVDKQLDDESADDARIAKALNSHSSLTGLGGVGYGTYRFTTAFTDHVANHEASDLWASYLHDKSSVDGLSVGNLRADYDLTYDGVVVGSDFYDNGTAAIGAAFAYADGDVSTKSGISTKNDVDYYGGMIYGSVKGGAGVTYRAEIGYNRSSNDLTQWNTGTRITGSVDADAFHVGVAAEKEIRTGSSVWTPFLGLQYIDLSIDDYSDSLGFRHEGDSAGLWNMPVGVNYKYEVANGAWTYAPTVTLGYRFAFGDDSVDETLRYDGVGSSFSTEIAEDSFFTRIGFEAKKDNIGFGVHYGYERGSNTEANQWGINCSFFF